MQKYINFILSFLLFATILPGRAVSHASDPSTWTAVDGLGRKLPDQSEVGSVRKDRYVGIFYWTWHDFFSVWEPRNITKILEEHPEAANDFSHAAWGNMPSGSPYFWNEPMFGYYSSKDVYVLRKHAELLADALIDVIVFDCTNDTNLFLDAANVLFKVFEQAKEEGVNVPKFAFMLNINPTVMMENNRIELRELYEKIYKLEKYKDLWFYWEGKPIVFSTDKCLDASDPLEKEILDFFTFRRMDDMFDTKDTKYEDKMWGWLSVYPQTKYGVRDDGTVEQMAVGIAQNYSDEHRLTAMNDPRGGVHGRSFAANDYSYSYTYKGKTITVDSNTENKILYGLNFQQQWDYALSVDPDFIFVTGWNEWIAGRWEKWIDVDNAFPDQYNDEYSRDIEPSNGFLKDHYYYQLVANVRRFKGVNDTAIHGEMKTIDIHGDISQWNDVKAEYVHYTGNTPKRRSHKGYGRTKYTSDTMQNDIVKAKVAYDEKHVYFYVETVDALTSPSDNAWMRLFLDVDSDDMLDWEGFEYVVNRLSPSEKKAVLERSLGGWNWEKVGDVEYSVKGNVLQLALPRNMIGMEKAVNFNFKWVDNTQEDGDIMDFYKSGDSAPIGRFSFVFRSTPLDSSVERQGLTLPWYTYLSMIVAVISVLMAVGFRLFVVKRKLKSSS